VGFFGRTNIWEGLSFGGGVAAWSVLSVAGWVAVDWGLPLPARAHDSERSDFALVPRPSCVSPPPFSSSSGRSWRGSCPAGLSLNFATRNKRHIHIFPVKSGRITRLREVGMPAYHSESPDPRAEARGGSADSLGAVGPLRRVVAATCRAWRGLRARRLGEAASTPVPQLGVALHSVSGGHIQGRAHDKAGRAREWKSRGRARRREHRALHGRDVRDPRLGLARLPGRAPMVTPRLECLEFSPARRAAATATAAEAVNGRVELWA
jgi:hypothetical protein